MERGERSRAPGLTAATPPRLLLDTNALLRFVGEPKRLSTQQSRALRRAVQRMEPIGLSPISLLEIAVLHSLGRIRLKGTLAEFFEEVRSGPEIQVLPITEEIALEVALLGPLKDPADKAIVATALVHGLQLVTSDERIVDSRLVRVID